MRHYVWLQRKRPLLRPGHDGHSVAGTVHVCGIVSWTQSDSVQHVPYKYGYFACLLYVNVLLSIVERDHELFGNSLTESANLLLLKHQWIQLSGECNHNLVAGPYSNNILYKYLEHINIYKQYKHCGVHIDAGKYLDVKLVERINFNKRHVHFYEYINRVINKHIDVDIYINGSNICFHSSHFNDVIDEHNKRLG